MDSARVARRRHRDDDWLPPAWTAPIEPSQRSVLPNYAPIPSKAPIDFAPFLSIAAPQAVTGVLAGLFSVISFFSANGSVPRGVIALAGIHFLGFAAARAR